MPVDELYLQELHTRIHGLTSRLAEYQAEEEATTLATAQPVPQPAAQPTAQPAAHSSAQPKAQSAPQPAAAVADRAIEGFLPLAPKNVGETGLPEGLIDSLALKFILHQGASTGHAVAKQLGLRFDIMQKLLARLKAEQKVVHRGAGKLNDYFYELTEKGNEEAMRLARKGSYFGVAPVHFDDYLGAVKSQGVRGQRISKAAVRRTYGPLDLDESLLNRIGQALDAGKGFFLYGMPGNGKTSVAELVSEVYSQHVWIPRALYIDGHIVQLFDPCIHIEATVEPEQMQLVDNRWICIRRPAVVVGGELTMDRLEITRNRETGVNEAPLQLKSNCGTLVIDDFGRQRMPPAELLNRWIVPLDRAYDFLNLPCGKSIRVPFDQVLVFSTNLQPHDLVDEAFLRRIPYKIEVNDPTEPEFLRLVELYASRLSIPVEQTAVEHLLETHYRRAGRQLRRCQARDLLMQVRHYCQFNELPLRMTPEYFDLAAANYFALSGN